MVYETAEQLEEALWWWQHELRIGDWDIRAELVRGYDIGDKLANADIHLEGNRATVKLVEWGDIPPDVKADEAFADMEQSLVHELLHVLFKPFEDGIRDDSLEHQYVEQAINKLAYALVKLKHGGSP